MGAFYSNIFVVDNGKHKVSDYKLRFTLKRVLATRRKISFLVACSPLPSTERRSCASKSKQAALTHTSFVSRFPQFGMIYQVSLLMLYSLTLIRICFLSYHMKILCQNRIHDDLPSVNLSLHLHFLSCRCGIFTLLFFVLYVS